MNANQIRQSSRAKKLSSAMRVVDNETRKIVLKKRLNRLEVDNLLDEIMYGVNQLTEE